MTVFVDWDSFFRFVIFRSIQTHSYDWKRELALFLIEGNFREKHLTYDSLLQFHTFYLTILHVIVFRIDTRQYIIARIAFLDSINENRY